MSNIVINYLEYGILAAATILLCALVTHWLLEDRNARPKPDGHDTQNDVTDKTPEPAAGARADRLPAPSRPRGKHN
jgi:hypothetical protein